jgi:hypothetical protein
MGAQAPICITPNAYSYIWAYNNSMKSIAQTWIHWLTAAAVLLGSIAPVHARPIFSDASQLKMQICAPSGDQIDLLVDLKLPEVHQPQTGCAYCLVQDSHVPSIDLDLQFAVPETIFKFHSALRTSPLPIIGWMRLPSRAPPFLS